MSSIHKQSSHTSKSFSSTSSNDNGSRGRSSADDLWDFYLPISRKGRFFKDSSFDHARDQFDSAIADALKKWGEEDLLKETWDDADMRFSNNLSRYRKLRSHNLKEDNQAATVTSDNTCHKIVMDVHDFMDGEVKVKVVGDRELVVEGRIDPKARELSASSNTFKRRFSLPDSINIDAITSVMSLDGILTITAPKTTHQTKEDSTIPIRVTGAKTNVTETRTSSSTSQAGSGTTSTKVTDSGQEKRETAKSQQVPIQVNSTQTSSQTVDGFTDSKADSKTSAENGAKKQSSSGYRNSTTEQKSDSEQREHWAGKQGNTETKTQTSTSSTSTEFPDIPFSLRDFVPIKRRGHFFDDSFFEDTRSDFKNAVNEVLRKWDTDDFLKDAWDDTDLHLSSNLKRYRRLRSHDMNEDNQAVTVTSDNTCHKIVMDVHDFMDGEVKVKVVGDRELVVEGRIDPTKARELSASSNTFKRRFSLPDSTNIDAITSAMSLDGILTITAPKTVNQPQEEGSTIPIKLTGTKTSVTETHTSTSTSQTASGNSASAEKLSEIHEEGCLKNELRTNITESVQHEEDKPTPVKTDTSTAVDESISQMKGSQESSEQFTYSQATSRNSASDLIGTQTVDQKTGEDVKKQEEKVTDERVFASESSKGIAIPIKTRGVFFNDTFFEDTWKDYQDAVRDVVIKWGDCSTCDDLTCYRKLRTRDLKDENQAVRSSEDESNYKVVVDVQDFMKGGEISVKVEDARELVVEGHVQQEAGGAKSLKHFLRRFVLPSEVVVESVTSVMSSDGVLTITAPKTSSKLHFKDDGVKQSESVRDSTEQVVRLDAGVTNTQSSADRYTDHSRESCSTVSTSSQSSAIPVQLTSQAQFEKASEITVDTREERAENAQHKSGASQESRINFDDADTHKEAAEKNCTFLEESDTDTVHRRLQKESRAKSESDDDMEAGSSTKIREYLDVDPAYKNRLLNIKTRGLFFDDSFFLESRPNFKTAVKDVLRKSHEEFSPDDDGISAYRNLRLRDLKLENQAVHVDDDRYTQMILLDVYDFLGGEVTAKVVEGKELVVEGRAQRQSGTSLTILSFLRRFPLPDRADLTAIMAVMSSDGVLLIIVPKLKKYSKDKALNKEACIERHSRMDVDVGRGLREKNVRESSRESEGRSLGSFLSTGLRHSPELSSFRKEMSTDSQHSRMDNFSDTGHSWDDRKMQDSSRASSSASSSTYQHSTDLF